jgi:hypothetical protein
MTVWSHIHLFLSSPKLSGQAGIVLRMNFLVPFPQVAVITEISLTLGEAYTVEWDTNIRDEEKIDCYPDDHGVSEANCMARGCVWEVTLLLRVLEN